MKFKFTKLAALLLAGAALLAVGCTDYEVDIQKVDKKVDELAAKTAADLDAQVNALKAMISTLEQNYKDADSALKQQLEGQIQDLQNLKLDKSTFEQYKSETAQTLKLLNDAIQEIKDDYATKEELQAAVADISAKLNDYVLKTTFDEFVAIAATKQELQDAKDKLEQDITDLETKLEGEITEAKQQMIEELGKLNQALEQINGALESLDERVTLLEGAVADVIDELAFAEGDLQGYIDDAAADALEQAKAYVDEYLEYIIDQLNEILGDIYDRLAMALQRIQSIQYVPDYDDLKITVNMSYVYIAPPKELLQAPAEEGEEGENEVTVMDQPTKITYQFLPSQYAETIAEGIKENIEEKWTREEAKDWGYKGIVAFFNVKPVNTRADEAEEELEYGFEILDVLSADNTTGEITFLVMPKNIASAQFAANGLKPVKEIYMTDNTWDYNYRYEDFGLFWDGDDLEAGAAWYNRWFSDNWVHYVYNIEDLVAFEARSAFAAQLRMYHLQDFDYNEDAFEGDEIDWDNLYIDYENELASPYNVLYPDVTEIEIPGEPYKPTYDEEGNPEEDEDGYAVLEPAMFEHQQLPYSSLRENPAGEKKDQDPKGYRVILDESIPAVKVDGGPAMTFADAAEKYGLILPAYTIEFKEFTFSNEANAKEPLYIGTEKVYAEVEMNPDKSAAERKLAIGDVITGYYTYSTAIGSFEGWGDVTITPALGDVALNALIPWTWKYDAIVDHNLFYPEEQDKDADGNTPVLYSRVALPININADDLKYLTDNLDITLESFSHKDPVAGSVKITYCTTPAEDESAEMVALPDDSKFAITALTIEDGELLADIEGFEWDKTYKITATYDLEDAVIDVTFILTTVDRNREKVVLGPFEHTFIVNGEEFYDGYYHWSSDPMHKAIFEAFDEDGVINIDANEDGDFVVFDDQEDFNEGELIDHLRMADPSGTAKGYVDFNRADIVLNTLNTLTPEVLAGELFNSGERSADDPNLWIGNVVTRNVTTYIGEEVEMQMKFNFKVPDYNFLHLNYYTFNMEKEVADFITKRDFADNDGSVLWWSQVYPSYFNDVPAEGAAPSQANRVSNRYALADYDVAYINLAELAFNVVDEKDEIIDDADLKKLGLTAKFIYTDEELGEKDLPEVDQIDPEFLLYKSLWIDNTIFYYRTNEMKFIPALGELYLTVGTPGEQGDGGFAFPVATRFEFPKAAVNFPAEILDYSTYAMVRWTPFKAPQTKDVEIILDENKIYREPLFKGMTLMDNRPNGVSYYVIKEGEWVVGNAPADATAASKKNGYLNQVVSKDAYHITTDFVYDTSGIPSSLKKLLTIEVDEDGVPYVVYNYTSEVQFHGVVTIPVVVVLTNPWQEEIKFVYNIIIKGIGD